MAWEDAAKFQADLKAALDTYDWTGAARLCGDLTNRLYATPEPLPLRPARAILKALRAKRQFRLMTGVAEALLRCGQNAAEIRRQQAQALIDRGLLLPAEELLRPLTADPAEGAEAIGLTGRIYKQLYVNLSGVASDRRRDFLRRSAAAYGEVYSRDGALLWHGINLLALAARAARDGVPLDPPVDPTALAARILHAVRAQDSDPSAWDLAIEMEALVALGDRDAAVAKAHEYTAHRDADAFELGGTLRQLREVWGLEGTTMGEVLLPILRGALLRREGGGLRVPVGATTQEIERLEKNFDQEGLQTLQWYKTGLERARSVARVERKDGKGIGTAWLARAADFFASRTGLILVTNAHVISDPPNSTSLTPPEVLIHFQELGAMCRAGKVLWSSPVKEFDATLFEIPDPPAAAQPLPVSQAKVRMTVPPQRLYVIGHPGGRDIEFSLQNNVLLGLNEKVLHYRTPTEPGSSGSPVFEAKGWEVVALHHAGDRNMPKPDGSGVHDANEGISMRAIRAAIEASS